MRFTLQIVQLTPKALSMDGQFPEERDVLTSI